MDTVGIVLLFVATFRIPDFPAHLVNESPDDGRFRGNGSAARRPAILQASMPQAVVFRKTNGRLARFDPILIWTNHRRLGARATRLKESAKPYQRP